MTVLDIADHLGIGETSVRRRARKLKLTEKHKIDEKHRKEKVKEEQKKVKLEAKKKIKEWGLLNKPILFKDPPYKDTYVFDIETSPYWGTYYDEWKVGNIVWREKDSFIMSFAITELNSGKVKVFALPDYKEWKEGFCKHCKHLDSDNIDESLIKDLWEYFNKSITLIGHNIDRFDIRRVNARFLKYGLTPPSPYQTIDTYKKHKQVADSGGNSLNNITQYYKIGKKLETEKNIARKCLEGDMQAWEQFKKYNTQDVVINEKLFLKERGWYKNIPNMNLQQGTLFNCSKCGSEHMKKENYFKTKVVIYEAWNCLNCGGWSQGDRVMRDRPLR